MLTGIGIIDPTLPLNDDAGDDPKTLSASAALFERPREFQSHCSKRIP